MAMQRNVPQSRLAPETTVEMPPVGAAVWCASDAGFQFGAGEGEGQRTKPGIQNGEATANCQNDRRRARDPWAEGMEGRESCHFVHAVWWRVVDALQCSEFTTNIQLQRLIWWVCSWKYRRNVRPKNSIWYCIILPVEHYKYDRHSRLITILRVLSMDKFKNVISWKVKIMNTNKWSRLNNYYNFIFKKPWSHRNFTKNGYERAGDLK